MVYDGPTITIEPGDGAWVPVRVEYAEGTLPSGSQDPVSAEDRSNRKKRKNDRKKAKAKPEPKPKATPATKKGKYKDMPAMEDDSDGDDNANYKMDGEAE